MIDDDSSEESGAPIRSAYQNYSESFGRQPKPDNATQKHLQYGILYGSHKAYQQLWEQAARLVLFQLGKMKKNGELTTVNHDDMDAIQEANLAVGEALKRWDPSRGTLATFLIPHIRGSLLKYAQTMHNGGVGSHHVTVFASSTEDIVRYEHTEGLDMPDVSTYGETLVYEQGQGIPTPEDVVQRLDVYEALADLPPMDSELLSLVHLQEYPVEQVAEDRNVSRETIRRHLRSAEQRMHVALDK